MDDEGSTRPNIDRTDQARADEAELNERDLADAGRISQAAADKAELVERDLIDEIARLHSELHKLEVEARDLRQARAFGAIIEQAAGIIMATVDCTADEALAHLVAQSRRMDVEVGDVARALVNNVQSNHRSRPGGQGASSPDAPPSVGSEPVGAGLFGVGGDMSAAGWVTITAEHVEGLTAPRAAREIVRNRLSPIVDTPVLDDVLLATSEIVTNAVQHSSGPYVVRICQDTQGTRVRIGLTDTSDIGLPEPHLPDRTSEHGRGLHIVDTLAAAWGWTPLPSGGKEVWFECGLQANR